MTISQTITYTFELPREYKKWQEFLTNLEDSDLNGWKEELTSSQASYTMQNWCSIDLGERIEE